MDSSRYHFDTSSSEGSDDDHNLEAVVGTRWRVLWVSPLRGLQYTEARLKRYALHLREALQVEGSEQRLQAKVTPLPELRPDENLPIPLQIYVDAVNGDNKRQCLYNGIMLSWTKPHRPDQNNFVNLPLLLCRGGTKATEGVHKLLQVFFNCSIKDMTFEAEHMLWVIGFAAHFHDTELDNLHLRFTCPGLGNEHFLDFTIQMSLLKEMWRSIRQTDTGYITYDEIISLRDKCYTKLHETYGVKTRMLQLQHIKWRGCFFSANGCIKFSEVLANFFLKFVEDICYDQESGITGHI